MNRQASVEWVKTGRRKTQAQHYMMHCVSWFAWIPFWYFSLLFINKSSFNFMRYLWWQPSLCTAITLHHKRKIHNLREREHKRWLAYCCSPTMYYIGCSIIMIPIICTMYLEICWCYFVISRALYSVHVHWNIATHRIHAVIMKYTCAYMCTLYLLNTLIGNTLLQIVFSNNKK